MSPDFVSRRFQQSGRSDADGKDDNQRHECRRDALLSAISTSGGLSASGRRLSPSGRLSAACRGSDAGGLGTAAGSALALQSTGLTEGSNEANVTHRQNDEWHHCLTPKYGEIYPDL